MKINATKIEQNLTLDETFRKGFFRVIRSLSTSYETAAFLITLRALLFILSMIKVKKLNLADNTAKYVTYIFYINPYQLEYTYSYLITTSIVISVFIINILTMGGFVLVEKYNLKKHICCIFGFWIYFYQYVGFFWIFPELTSFYFHNSGMSSSLAMLFNILITFTIAHSLFLFIFLNLFFTNFFFKTNDHLARGFEMNFFHMQLCFLILMIANSFHFSFIDKYISVFGLLMIIYFFFSFSQSYFYPNHKISSLSFFILCILFWINLTYFFSVVYAIQRIQSNFIVINSLGFVFISANFFAYKRQILKNVVFLNFKRIHNSLIFERKIQFLFTLIEFSLSNKRYEFQLISIINNHYKNCKDMLCSCKTRESLWDPQNNTGFDANLPCWNDLTFLKNWISSEIKAYLRENPKELNIQLLFTFFSIEVLENTILGDFKLQKLKKECGKLKNVSISFYLSLMEMNLIELVNKKNNNFKYSINRYERLILYDKVLNQLR